MPVVAMKIREILKSECIVTDLRAETKTDVIRELSALMAEQYPEVDAEALCEVLTERERLGSTGIGHGVAILHGKLATLNNIVTGFGRSPSGIDFDAQDGEPVHLFFVLIAPKNSASLHLKAMARLSRLLKDPHFRNRLFEANNCEKVFDVIVSEDERF